MRTSKQWTNVTFTRRVDHQAGAHRPPRQGHGPRVCEHCGNAYVKGRWIARRDEPVRAMSLRALASPEMTLCPACRMETLDQFGGEVRISGAFYAEHRPEVVRLVQNEAKRAAVDNPLARILLIKERTPASLIVRTTTEHLAKRLGQALKKAFDGDVHYGFAHENKFAHVTWSRGL
jgi:hypothetical protein